MILQMKEEVIAMYRTRTIYSYSPLPAPVLRWVPVLLLPNPPRQNLSEWLGHTCHTRHFSLSRWFTFSFLHILFSDSDMAKDLMDMGDMVVVVQPTRTSELHANPAIASAYR